MMENLPNPEMACEGDMPELLNFLHRVFCERTPDHARFEDISPDLFQHSEEKARRILVLRDEERIIAAAGSHPLTLNIAGCKISATGLGQVATAPEMTGRGCMTRLLEASIARMEEEGAAVSWLGGRRDRYGRFGWEYILSGYNYSMSEKIGRSADDSLQVSQEKCADALMTEGMFVMRESCVYASDSLVNYSVRMTRKSGELFVAHGHGSTSPVAWAVVFPAEKRIAEYCGSIEGVLKIVKTAAVRLGGVTTFVSPVDKGLNERLRAESSGVGFAGQMLLVVSVKKTVEQYSPYINSRLPSGFGVTLRMRLPGGGHEDANIGSGGTVVELDRRSMARLLFGPERATDIPGVDPGLVQLDAILPLPFCIPFLFAV